MEWTGIGGRIEIGPDSPSIEVTIRPWTRAEVLTWYRTGLPPRPRPPWWDKAVIARHPELGELNRTFDNLYGSGFDEGND